MFFCITIVLVFTIVFLEVNSGFIYVYLSFIIRLGFSFLMESTSLPSVAVHVFRTNESRLRVEDREEVLRPAGDQRDQRHEVVGTSSMR